MKFENIKKKLEDNRNQLSKRLEEFKNVKIKKDYSKSFDNLIKTISETSNVMKESRKLISDMIKELDNNGDLEENLPKFEESLFNMYEKHNLEEPKKPTKVMIAIPKSNTVH